MNKFPLIVVSIVAVVFLVLGSLTNVVGYQSVKSTVNDSPLFQKRTQRATNQQQNGITSQYLGMGRGNQLRFPINDNQTQMLKRAIEIIKNMDEKTFTRFAELCMRNIKQSNVLREISPSDLLQILCQLRTKSEALNAFIKDNNIEPPSYLIISLCDWAPGCIIYMVMVGLYAIVASLSFVLYDLFYSTQRMCRSVQFCS
jgi:hypothetical protein